MRTEGMPRQVRKARLEGDHDALSAMGKKGGKQAAENRAFEKAERTEELEKLRIAIAKIYSLSPDGEILPPEEDITIH